MDALQIKGLLLLDAALGYAVATIGMKLIESQIASLGITLPGHRSG
jgi:hypothetical protein